MWTHSIADVFVSVHYSVDVKAFIVYKEASVVHQGNEVETNKWIQVITSFHWWVCAWYMYRVYIYPFSARRQYHRCSKNLTSLLMSEFWHSPYINCNRTKYLSTKLGITKGDVCTWFNHQRYYIRKLEAQVIWKGNNVHVLRACCPSFSPAYCDFLALFLCLFTIIVCLH